MVLFNHLTGTASTTDRGPSMLGLVKLVEEEEEFLKRRIPL